MSIARVVTSLPLPVVGVVWQNRYEATTASILALRMAAAVLPNVRGKTGEHALQLQMPLASALLLLPTAATTPAITARPVPLAPEIAVRVVAAAVGVAQPTHLRPPTPVAGIGGATPWPIVVSMAGTTRMALVRQDRCAARKKASGPMATAVTTKTGARQVGAPAGMLPETAGRMAMAMMPIPTALTLPPVVSAAVALLTVPRLVPFVARQMAVGGLAPLRIKVLHPRLPSPRLVLLTK